MPNPTEVAGYFGRGHLQRRVGRPGDRRGWRRPADRLGERGVALVVTHPPPLDQYAAIFGGLTKIRPSVAPVIAIPTTAGTGAEVGRAALLTLSDERKLGFISPYIIPKRIICDPELTLSLPPKLTAATGLDALSHCIETLFSPRFNHPG